jgi:hypothetical protein
MKRKELTSRIDLRALCLGGAAALLLSVASTAAQAQTDNKAINQAIGEIAAARQASVNGMATRSAGMTVFSNSRIKTGESGSATVSLGKRGRVELGAKTDLTLQYANAALSGTLHAGRLVLSVPAGIALALNTPKGLVKSDGLQPTVVSLETGTEKMKVVAHLGEAQIVANGKTETVTSGEEVAIGSQTRGEGFQRRRLVAASLVGAGAGAGIGVASAGAAGQTAGKALGPVVVNAKPAASFTSLINTGINFSLSQLIGNGRDPERFFDVTIVCRDVDNFLCRRRSSVVAP